MTDPGSLGNGPHLVRIPNPPSSFVDPGPLAVFAMKYVTPLMGSFSLFAWASMNLLGRTYLRISRETLEYHHPPLLALAGRTVIFR